MSNPILEKIAIKLPSPQVIRQALGARRGLIGAGAGLAGGAGGMYGLREMGQQQLQREQEVQQLTELLNSYPELLNAPLYSQDPQALDPYGRQGGYGY